MDINKGNLQVLLQAAEYLERKEREAEHGYASSSPFYSRAASCKRNKQKNRPSNNSTRSVHNELEKHRRAQLRQCLEQLKQQMPLCSESVRHTTLNLLRRARLHIKRLQDLDESAQRMKEQLRWEQRELCLRLDQLLGGTERVRNDSLGSAMSSERSDSDREDVEVDVESVVFDSLETDCLGTPHVDGDHSYSSHGRAWL